ncbi:histidine triad nucleotide-binding protein [Coxiella endosymbiont of Amblyomma americanum]|uniref:histidine triad nucleotide-binding protein n=1 Tax=Coxiella endosymbiont of Amblyomma americanum TaxID=325775 RepID=UPI00057D5907|nr:histidine triad nucleotide-binding protein [Coxiella endosymbiont of Amblyomma americanum]AJC50541.1 Diadenosine tetraphosphate (Ap4A) hydrolase-like HIT family hydrolase [Coxiella endosymbiont of Amblyomma americanum]AUJ58875.1 histidine triad nucleotide-binding protein [Coxiella-like endosymbiont of Amblyomma americanum]
MKCIFCRISKGKLGKLIYEDDQVVAFHDITPQSPVHILIIPRRHIATINDISYTDRQLLGQMIMTASQLAKDNDIANFGYRLVLNCNRGGGQAIYHIHLHLLGGRRMKWPPG